MNERISVLEIPKQNLKIQIVKKSDEILEQIRKESAETAVMPMWLSTTRIFIFQKHLQTGPIHFPSIVLSSDGKWPMGIILRTAHSKK